MRGGGPDLDNGLHLVGHLAQESPIRVPASPPMLRPRPITRHAPQVGQHAAVVDRAAPPPWVCLGQLLNHVEGQHAVPGPLKGIIHVIDAQLATPSPIKLLALTVQGVHIVHGQAAERSKQLTTRPTERSRNDNWRLSH